MAEKKKSTVRKKKAFPKVPFIAIVVLGVAIIVSSAYSKAFLPVNNQPAELGNKPVQYNFGNRPSGLPDVPPAKVTTTNVSPGWDLSEVAQYGFSIQHPSNSTMMQHQGATFQTVSIQNYESNDLHPGGKLPRGKYYMEIQISDHKLGQNNSCEDSSMKDRQTVSIENISGIKGYKGTYEGDSDWGAIVRAICVSKSEVDYNIKVSEEYPEVTERIINSFQFTN
jgi:hypothetical protein